MKYILLLILVPVVAFSQLNTYGYFATNLEQTYNEPVLAGGETDYETSPLAWDYTFFNLMMQQSFDNFNIFININGAGGEGIVLQNYWGEYAVNRYLNVRAGKIYRRFGLYNEQLDAVPTYYGIEAPELFDSDHYMLSRFTTFMVHGNADLGKLQLNYSLSTENLAGGAQQGEVPIGFDLNLNLGQTFKIGTSGFFSGEGARADVGVGEGGSSNGVLPWMASDSYSVLGAYAEANLGDLMIQGAFWVSPHEAVRDADAVVQVINDGGVNQAQLERFLIDENGPVSASNVQTEVDYDVLTYYVRAGYSFATSIGEIAPYLQWDHFSNPETIANKGFGGDNEAGVADDGKFDKSTVGFIWRPVYQVAFKFDQSYHFYEFNGEAENYPEIRISLAYTFGL